MGRNFTVQQSFPEPSATSNPYVTLLARSIQDQPNAHVLTFTWTSALLRQYDAFHVHWPENLVTGKRRATTVLRQALFLLILLRLRLTRIPLVRTMHNLETPSGLNRRQRALLRLAERWTSLYVVLSDATPLPSGATKVVIPHGHYRTWFNRFPRAPQEPGRVLFVGLVRRYKGVEALVRAFCSIPAGLPATVPATLHVAGRPSSDELANELRRTAAGDPRVTLQLDFLSDPEFVDAVSRASLVVLPYPHMHNSGSVLAALSLDRPVLVPDNEVNRALAAEVGPGWVRTFHGVISGDDITTALEVVGTGPPARPNLSAREWDAAGASHLAAYRGAKKRRP